MTPEHFVHILTKELKPKKRSKTSRSKKPFILTSPMARGALAQFSTLLNQAAMRL